MYSAGKLQSASSADGFANREYSGNGYREVLYPQEYDVKSITFLGIQLLEYRLYCKLRALQKTAIR